MSECLVTKLKSSVDNENLSYFNCILLHIKTDGYDYGDQRRISIAHSGGWEFEILGDGEFTDVTGQVKYGKKVDSTYGPSSNGCWVGDGEYDVLIKEKSNLANLILGKTWYNSGTVSGKGFAGYIKHGEDIKGLKKLVTIQDNSGLIANSSSIPLSCFKGYDKLTTITCFANGDIGSLGACTALEAFYLGTKNCEIISGNISSLSGLTHLSIMRLQGTVVKGDFNELHFKNKTINTMSNGLITCNGVLPTQSQFWLIYDENGGVTMTYEKPE